MYSVVRVRVFCVVFFSVIDLLLCECDFVRVRICVMGSAPM